MICLTLNKSAGLPHIQLSTAVWLVDSFYFKLEGYRYVSCGFSSAWITWFLPSMMVKTTTPMIPRYFTMSSNCAFYYCFFERTLDAELNVIISYFLLAVWWPLLEGGHNCGPGKPFYTVTLIRGSTNKLDLTRAAHSDHYTLLHHVVH